jgi:hypothetical protein
MQTQNHERGAVIVGCARNCEVFLPAVLQNVGTIGNLYSKVAFVFVENDSADNTRKILQEWQNQCLCSSLICLDGLALQVRQRTARLAIARNAYMEALNCHHFGDYDHLIVLDFDDVNTGTISQTALIAAIQFLESCDCNAAVFANQLPYYDIWALRHDTWCPGDCWAEVENRPAYLPRHRAVERYLTNRQVTIFPNAPPVSVRSAFGGLGIYKIDFVRAARYVGLRPNGTEVCEHVAFNEAVLRAGGVLHIFPALLNQVPPEHIHPPLLGWWRLAADLDPRSYKQLSPIVSPIVSPMARLGMRVLGRRAPNWF